MAPTVELRLPLEVREAASFNLPPWTRGDDYDDVTHDHLKSQRRTLRQRHRRQASVAVSPTEPNVAKGEKVPRATGSAVNDLALETDTSDSDGIESDVDDPISDGEDEQKQEERPNETTLGPPAAIKSLTIPPPNAAARLDQHGGMHSEVHKILIGVGSVVGVILLAGVCLIAWKLSKRSRGRNSTRPDGIEFRRPSRASAVLAKLPFFKRRPRHQEWYNIQTAPQEVWEKEAPLTSSKSVARRLDSQFFAPDKPLGVARLDTSYLDLDADHVSPTSTALGGATLVNTMQNAAMKSPRASHYDKRKSSSASRYGYAAQRHASTSDISSLSSGFGDLNIVIPSPRPSHMSWRSNSQASTDSGGRRDTMYTEASEDLPPRFRTVNSWVRQQSGRLRREQDKEAAPPVPGLPLEQEFGLMLPDDEVPRKVEVDMTK